MAEYDIDVARMDAVDRLKVAIKRIAALESDLEAMRDQVEDMQDTINDCMSGIRQRDAELARLRKALEDAPHEEDCAYIEAIQNRVLRTPYAAKSADCNCWKSRALNPQPT